MRQPRRPPDIQKLYGEMPQLVSNEEFMKCVSSPTVGGKYVHWDNLRFRPVPDNLTLEQWWLALKMARLGGRRFVPLVDRSSKLFSYTIPDRAQEYLHELSMGLGGQVQLPEPILNNDSRDQYYVTSLIDESITSSQLEGAATTRKVAEEMLRTGRKPRDKSEQMILNNYRTMKRIGEFGQTELTPGLVFELHQLVTEHTLSNDGEAGRFRNEREKIAVYDNTTNEVIHEPPPASELPDRLERMCDFANGRTPDGFVHPMVRAIILHFWLAYDHPFVDGNGRTARALFYWSMKQAELWLCEYISISSVIVRGPSKYVRAFLYTETDDNDLTYFIMYHLNVIKQAVDHLHHYIKDKAQEVQRLQARLRGLTELNYRQRELIAHALRHPRQEYTFQSHQRSHNVVYETARRDLLNLEERGYLVRIRRGREFVFSPVRDLQDKLAS